jgi:tetratricopeptide (TPR) repeat protein
VQPDFASRMSLANSKLALHLLIVRWILNPNLVAAWYNSGWIRIYLGKPDTAIKHLERAMRPSPFDPIIGPMQAATAYAHFFAGRYDEALSWAQKAMGKQPKYFPAISIAAVSSAFGGRLEEAQKTMALLRRLDPGRRISNLKDRIPLRRPEDLARYEEGLRLAGLPE